MRCGDIESGWQPNDFVLAPDNYKDRKEVMFRGIETVRNLWRGNSESRRAGHGQDVDVRILPRPVQPELPVWVTAAGAPDTFRKAGEIGAHLLTHLLGQSVEELAEKIAVYRLQEGAYAEVDASKCLPRFPFDSAARLLERRLDLDETSLLQEFREAIRHLDPQN